MYYHIDIEQKNANSPKIEVRNVDRQDKDNIIKNICIPYLSNEKFICRGKIFIPDDIQTLQIVKSELSTEDWYELKGKDSSLKLFGPHGIILSDDVVDVTEEFMGIASKISNRNICKEAKMINNDLKKFL